MPVKLNSPREAVEAVFRFQELNPVPYRISINPGVEPRLDEYYGTPVWRDLLRPYLYGSFYVGGGSTEIHDGIFRDAFGSLIRKGNISSIEKPVLQSPSLSGYQWPEAESLADWDALCTQYKTMEGSFRLCGMAFGFFERAWAMRGFENLLMDMVDSPDFVDELLDGHLALRMKVFELIAERIPIEGFFGGGDDCDQRGPIMGLERWRRFIKPRLGRMIDFAHSLGKPIVTHMCGNVMPLVDDLMEMGLDALESCQPEAMDVFALKKITRGKLVLIGGLGVQTTLPLGTPNQVREQVSLLQRELGSGGGYILSSAKPVMEDVPTENAVAFLESVEPRLKTLRDRSAASG